MTTSSFGQRLRQARLVAGLTQAEVAERTSVQRTQIVNLESDRGEPSVATLISLCKALNVSADSLLGLQPTDAALPEIAAVQAELLALRGVVRQVAGTLHGAIGERDG